MAYSDSLKAILLQDVKNGIFSVEDRVGIISDAAALAFSGHRYSKTSDLLNLLEVFVDEPNFFVWKIILTTIREISKSLMFEEVEIQNAIRRFQKHLIGKTLHQKGWHFDKDDSINEQRFKALLFGHSAGDKKVIEAAFEMFHRFTKGEEDVISPNI